MHGQKTITLQLAPCQQNLKFTLVAKVAVNFITIHSYSDQLPTATKLLTVLCLNIMLPRPLSFYKVVQI